MNKNNYSPEKIIFLLIYFFVIIFCSFFIFSIFGHLNDYCVPADWYSIIMIFFANIVPYYLILKDKLYAFIYSLYVIIFIFLIYLTVWKNQFFHSKVAQDIWTEIWAIIVIIIGSGIVLCFNIMIKEHIKYIKLDYEERRKQNTLKNILLRIAPFFLCLLNLFVMHFINLYLQ